MKAHIEKDAPKTHAYLRHIFNVLLEHSPLREREVIEVKIVEGSTPFPKIVETTENSPDSTDMSEELEGIKERSKARYAALDEYMTEFFKPMIANPQSELHTLGKLTVIFSLVILDPEKIYRAAEKLGLKVPAPTSAETEDSNTPPTFTESLSELRWRGAVVSIRPNSKQFCVCRVAFSKQVGESVSWDEVADDIDQVPEEGRKTDWRVIYDTARQINKKITEATGKPLFKVSKLSFSRLA